MSNKRRRIDNSTPITPEQEQDLRDVQQTFEQFLNNENNPEIPEDQNMEIEIEEMPEDNEMHIDELAVEDDSQGVTDTEYDSGDEQYGGKRRKTRKNKKKLSRKTKRKSKRKTKRRSRKKKTKRKTRNVRRK